MLTEQGLDAVNLSGGYIDWLLTDIKETAAADKAKEVETSIRKKFHKKIWCQFTKAVRTYELVKPGIKLRSVFPAARIPCSWQSCSRS